MDRIVVARSAACALCLLLSVAANAERADREKPIHLEADRLSIDDVNKVQVLEGNAVLTQGTMVLRTSRLVVTQDVDGFQKAVATGGANGLAYFRQKREGVDEYTEGEAERIEHDARTETTQFFTRAWVRTGQDEVRGQYISYDALNEKYLVTPGEGTTKTATGAAQARVRAIIQPRAKGDSPAPGKNEALPLKPATTVNPAAN
ncbi:lipopolysaccharide transport periplasmic protein LptA [Accumulibacter sp.]|uniref:lipopolysaccharide transport periplasmic protein LptA n=1 Tax=Accumulibacter sp. TaxID=2053492 RepID=UPI0025DCCCCA|nr:lipopolysaccharide transport periplasmic protein LptA [Accumulibacter sp.]MCM8594745.1 lipopolysaccharide transport periplasmic protein LptA [Accumulibacter sp.]MCM8625838.1 lipopolysaccharide transport periplasmic protein LptA [Accumulibacter sp.]MDS4048891.1 lipopolysaccharide transport periplasmic protein LptA [Accumulibacter sp.]